ncbi:MAG: phage portal protein [Verrucomicrobia bacterium]|nr:phage portal protein [Verrucomicrobiota bacterium]
MIKRVRQSSILDRHGRPIAIDLFQGGITNRKGDTGPIYNNYSLDTEKIVSTRNWQQMMTSGRFLFANVPMVRGALLEQCALSFPLEPTYVGVDKEWGKQAEEWLLNWHRINSVRGEIYDQDTQNRLLLLGAKIDGDIYVALTETEDKYPLLQHIRGHRIGNRYNVSIVEAGPYEGLRICNGVVKNKFGRAVAYKILGETPDEDRIVSARSLVPCYRPDFSDQGRGISHLCASITSFYDINRLRDYEMRAQQIGSSIGIIEQNEDGEADQAAASVELPSAGSNTVGTASGLITETIEEGLIRYFKSGTGSGLEAFRQDRPSADASRFEDKIATGALYGIEWDPNFALAIKEPGGVWARTIIEKVRRCIANNQKMVARVQQRTDGYGLSKAIKLGLLPYPPNGDWYSWEYTGPARITADSGNEESAKREAYKLGLLTLREWASERGKWWIEDIREQREAETVDLLERAQKIAARFGLKIVQALELLEQRTPNGAGSGGESDNSETMLRLEETKATADAYGVGVRAGAITPNIDDENFIRSKLGLPSITEPVRTAWTEDEGYRRPITLLPPGVQPSAPQKTNSEDNDE